MNDVDEEGVRADTSLKEQLDTLCQFLERNPDAVIVVSRDVVEQLQSSSVHFGKGQGLDIKVAPWMPYGLLKEFNVSGFLPPRTVMAFKPPKIGKFIVVPRES